MEKSALVPALHTKMILEAAARQGVGADEILAAVGFEALPEGPAALVPASVHEALYDEAARRTKNPVLSLVMGEVATGDRFDVFAYALRSVATLGAAFELANRIHRRLSPHLDFQVLVDGDGCRWVIEASRQEGWVAREIEYLFSMVPTALREMAGRTVPVQSVHFKHEPAGPVAAYVQRFGAEVRFSQPANQISFPGSIVSWPSIFHDPALAATLAPYLKSVETALPKNSGIIAQARTAIESALERGAPTERQVATMLGVSVRTLQYRLREQDLTYRQLLETIRRERAEHLLIERGLPIAEAARKLGYGDGRSLHRAFHRWHGCSPSAYRSYRAGSTPDAED